MLQCIDEQEEVDGIWVEEMEAWGMHALTSLIYGYLHEISPHYREPVDMVKLLDRLTIWRNLTLERCAIGSCSPWTAKELQWYRGHNNASMRVPDAQMTLSVEAISLSTGLEFG